ncbi:MAG: bacterial transcriptional activator domain-containing protein [Gallionellaceae bacterium]|nr:bacterial transcriptional activator domain-containing protein [Gallionellaceae bacterium]
MPLVIFFVLLFFFWRPIEDYDIWFYMVSGRETAAIGKIPDTMFYILPMLGEPASYIEWGFGLIYYWAYLLGGYTGMTALNAAFGATTLLLAYRAAIGKRGWLHPAALLALALVAWWITARINYRAETALLLCMAATLLVLEKYAEQGNWRWLIFIPIAGWLLIQLHPSAVFLLSLLGAYAIEFFFFPPPGRTGGQVVFVLSATAVATLVLACLNPYGWSQVALPFIALFSAKGMMTDITEYLPVLDTEYAFNFAAMAALGAVALIFQRVRRISSGLLIAVFGTLTFLYVRNIGLFALVLLAPLVRYGLQVFPEKISLRWQYSGALAVLIVLLVLPLWQGKLGSGIKQGVFPEKSAVYIKQHLRSGHILNFFDYGGYLAWALGPDFLVFVDGHDTTISRALQLHDAIFRADPGWENSVAQYRIDAIFTPTLMQFSGRVIPLVEHLIDSSEWRLVAREEAGLLFLRADLVGGAALDKRQIWEQMIEEAQRELGDYPDHPDPWAALVKAHRALGDSVKAEAAMQRYLQLSKRRP